MHAVAAKCTSSPRILGASDSKYPSLLNNFPEPLSSPIDERELVLQCMIAFDMMNRPVMAFPLMYREQDDELKPTEETIT